MNRMETGRQIVHFLGILSIFFAYWLGGFITGAGALVISLGFFLLSFYVKMKHEIRKALPVRIRALENLEDSFHDLIDSLERESSGIRYMGAILFFLAIGLILVLFPLKIAVLSIIVLSVGDSFSTMVGIHWGRHKTGVNPKKSWEGTLAGLGASFFVCIFFTSPPIALAASGVGMFMELMPFRINDNLLMPFSVGVLLWGFSVLGLAV